MKLHGLVPNSYIHVSVADTGNILITHRYMNVDWERGREVSFLEIHKSDLLCSVNFSIVIKYL
jgi:hypothetical protein